MAIKVLSKIKHNGKYYDKGEVIVDIKKSDEQRLIKLGVVSSLSSKDEADKKNSNKGNSGEE